MDANKADIIPEEWIRWNPTNIPEGDYYVTDVVVNLDGTKIILDDEKNVVEVLFEGFLPFISVSDETTRMVTWENVQAKYQDRCFFENWFFYKVENSRLAKWIEEESHTIRRAEELTHYSIITEEAVVDMVSMFEPEIKVSEMIKTE